MYKLDSGAPPESIKSKLTLNLIPNLELDYSDLNLSGKRMGPYIMNEHQ